MHVIRSLAVTNGHHQKALSIIWTSILMTRHKNNSRIQDLIDLRRKAVIDLLSQGITTVRELADRLGCSKSLIHMDIQYLRAEAHKEIHQYASDTLPREIKVQEQGLDNLIRKSYEYINNHNVDAKTVLAAIDTVKQCYREKMTLLSSATLVSKIMKDTPTTADAAIEIEEENNGLHSDITQDSQLQE
jgi:DeoR/GlpR family transcriptional regulator of sugar metabolism